MNIRTVAVIGADGNMGAKVSGRIDRSLGPQAVVSTGTSGLSVTALAENFSAANRTRYLGIHFFNPPYSMTLYEMIRSPWTDPALFASMAEHLRVKLRRDTVDTADSPAFLANRIGFHSLNKAMQAAERHQDRGGVDYIDAVLGPFTGREIEDVEAGITDMSGPRPVNPSGGLIGCGHPVGASGVRMLLDLFKQVTGQAGAYQVRSTRNAMMLNIGGSATTNFAFVVGR